MTEPWIDFNGDGQGDEYEHTVGADGADEYRYDSDNDGDDDAIAVDYDHDGLMDELQTDDNGDGTVDHIEVDDNGDGIMDHTEDVADDTHPDDSAASPGLNIPGGLFGGAEPAGHDDTATDPSGLDGSNVTPDNPDDPTAPSADPEGLSPELSGLIDPYAAN